MHVGLNLVYLVPGETGGTETYARELAPRLAAMDGLRVTAFVNRELGAGGLGGDVETVVVPVDARNRVQWVRGEQQLLPGLARRAGVDVLHSLANTAPLRGGVPRVVTIHDLLHRVHPDTHFGPLALGMRVLVTGAARTADRIVVDAASTRDDLVRLLGTDPAKVDVVPLGVRMPAGAGGRPGEGGAGSSAAVAAEADLRGRYDLGDRRVVLSVSAKRPHKNLVALLDALARLDAAERPVLVLPGYPTPHERELREHASALGIAGDVRFPAWVSPADLEGLYALAGAFVFPSRYEGFGLPVLEAMARGVPVATSAQGSLAEVAGDAALVFDPGDVDAIAAALSSLLRDEALAARLRAAGLERARTFTWERTAALTLAAYRRVVG